MSIWIVGTALLLALWSCTQVPAALALRPWNASSLLVFGDSTVDPGNNNRLSTAFKADFPPYGKDFFGGRPTGRFCDGRLATDFIAEFLGVSQSIPAFLDPHLTPAELKSGVSFASASAGYDDFTSINAGVLTFGKQIEYLKHYKLHLAKQYGAAAAQKAIENSLVVLSAGTNDFIMNYYFYDNRSSEFTEPKYEDYLVSLMSGYVKEIHRTGARQFVVVGIPPMGCLPVVKTLLDSVGCYQKYNDVAMSFNSKIVRQLAHLRKDLGLKAAYLNIYQVFEQVMKHPRKYGFKVTEKGCCGSGTVEFGETCRGQTTCDDPKGYVYWDAVHPTEKMYKIIADLAMRAVGDEALV